MAWLPRNFIQPEVSIHATCNNQPRFQGSLLPALGTRLATTWFAARQVWTWLGKCAAKQFVRFSNLFYPRFTFFFVVLLVSVPNFIIQRILQIVRSCIETACSLPLCSHCTYRLHWTHINLKIVRWISVCSWTPCLRSSRWIHSRP